MLTQTAVSQSFQSRPSFPFSVDMDWALPDRERDAGPTGIPMSFARNSEIYGEAEPAGLIYLVVSGVVRASKLLPDGRRQISAFHMAGDLFGFEPDEVRHFSAEAVVPTKLVAFKWQGLIAAGVRSGAFIRELLHVTMKGLRHTQEQLLLIGRKNALERVAAFVLEMGNRTGNRGVVELAMPRHDIADYLGLTLETVSRMFAELRSLGTIELDGARRVCVLDLEQLTALGS
jgi:CRP/FNR family transcriptional regulator, nitrogen fixation regulation protein